VLAIRQASSSISISSRIRVSCYSYFYCYQLCFQDRLHGGLGGNQVRQAKGRGGISNKKGRHATIHPFPRQARDRRQASTVALRAMADRLRTGGLTPKVPCLGSATVRHICYILSVLVLLGALLRNPELFPSEPFAIYVNGSGILCLS
jgi:hypothetical protein